MSLRLILAACLTYNKLPSNNHLMIEEWMNIYTEITKNLMKSIPRYLKDVVHAKGYPTK